MLKAILLDLDNTMILYDEPGFYERYFKRLYKRFGDHFSQKEFRCHVITATMSLRDNHGEKSNFDCFMDSFSGDQPKLGHDFRQRFIRFYQEDYDKIPIRVTAPDNLHQVLNQLKRMRLKQVLASNPIFPRIALEKRMGWANIDVGSFDLLTHMENMSYIKPNTEYYKQICEKIEISPECCLMVGNDMVNDMSAADAGIKTYLTTEVGEIDYSSLRLTDMPQSRPHTVRPPDFTGPFAGVVGVIRNILR